MGQPDGDRRIRVHRVRGAGPGGDEPHVRAARVRGGGAAPAQEGDPLSPGTDQLHPQRRTGELRAALRPSARAFDLRDRVSRRRRRARLQAGDLAGGVGFRLHGRAGRAQHSGDQGHRRLDDLSRRSLARQGRRAAGRDRQHQHLRRRFRADCRSAAESARARPRLHRPSDAQRASGAHGRVGGLLRAAVQFPRDPLLRSRGAGDRHQVARDDEPLRQDPHSDQRGRTGKIRPDPGIPRSLPRGGCPAHRDGVVRPVPDRGFADGGRRQAARDAGHVLRRGRQADSGARRVARRSCKGATS